MQLTEWMSKEITLIRPGPENRLYSCKMPTIERFAELVSVNGGSSEIKNIGQVRGTPNFVYKRIGLTLEEAIELANMSGIISGFAYASEFPELTKKEVILMVQDEVKRMKEKGFNPFASAEIINQDGTPGSEIVIYDEKDMKEMIYLEKEVNKGIRNVNQSKLAI